MKRDSIANTFVVAGGLCIVCSLLVSGSAVLLKDMQDKNVELDKKRNILEVAGLAEEKLKSEEIEAFFEERSGEPWVKDIIIDLATGEDVTGEHENPTEFDQFRAAKTDGEGTSLDKKEDFAGIKNRENHSHVYIVMNADGEAETYVFPVRGRGLWSTLYGFLALESDLQTVVGLTFYLHGETPGLGGEVDNEIWKAKWREGKQVFAEGDDGVREVALRVVKGSAGAPELEYKIDGLSGATITSNGVTNLIKFWMGPSGFGNYIDTIQGTTAGN